MMGFFTKTRNSLLLLGVLCLASCNSQSKDRNSGLSGFRLGVVEPEQALPDPKLNSFDSLNAFFDRGFAAALCYTDLETKNPAQHNDQVLSFKEIVEKKGRILEWTDQPTLVFPVPSDSVGDKPLYSAYDGGYVHIFNGFNKTYSVENISEKDLPPYMELVYVCRKYPSTAQEQFHAGYGWPKFKFDNEDNIVVGISDFFTPFKNKKGNFADLETVVINEVYYGPPRNEAEIFISDSRGDYISAGTFTNPINGFPNYIRNAGIGSNGHPVNHDFFGMWYTLGRVLTPLERCEVIKHLKKLYPRIGKRPSQPHCIPTIAWNTKNKTFDVAINYHPGDASGVGSEIDSARTIIHWYYGNAKTSTGNPLDEQDLIATRRGLEDLSLKRADFSKYFPNAPSRNIVNVGITVFNKKGESFREVCAKPFLDEFN